MPPALEPTQTLPDALAQLVTVTHTVTQTVTASAQPTQPHSSSSTSAADIFGISANVLGVCVAALGIVTAVFKQFYITGLATEEDIGKLLECAASWKIWMDGLSPQQQAEISLKNPDLLRQMAETLLETERAIYNLKFDYQTAGVSARYGFTSELSSQFRDVRTRVEQMHLGMTSSTKSFRETPKPLSKQPLPSSIAKAYEEAIQENPPTWDVLKAQYHAAISAVNPRQLNAHARKVVNLAQNIVAGVSRLVAP